MGSSQDDDAIVLQRVLDSYRAMRPVKEIIEYLRNVSTHSSQHWLSLQFQAKIVSYVVNDHVCDKHPPHRSYTYRFLKTYMSEIERNGLEASEELVCELFDFVVSTNLCKDTIDAEDMHHVSFSVPLAESKSSIITCRVASVFNEVGLKLWEAGWFLAEYALAHPKVFDNRIVLELGAGVGFTGLVVATCSKPQHVIVTDYAPNVMQNLRYNVEINTNQLKCAVDVEALDWETWRSTETSEADEALPDILLAGDCVYDVASFPCLMRVLRVFLHSKRGRRPSPVAIFAATIRNQATFQTFLDQVKQHEIQYEDITESSVQRMGPSVFQYENRDQIRLCKLFV